MKYSQEQYDAIINRTLARLKELSTVKGGEYALAEDRLANFRRNAAELDLTMFQVWAVYAGKHWDALRTFIKDHANSYDRPRSEAITGRAEDMIVYLILFLAIFDECFPSNPPRKGEFAKSFLNPDD